MRRQLLRRGWLALLGLAWVLTPAAADAWGPPVPVRVDSMFVYKFDVIVGPAAFGRPGAPWYTYFPADPHLMAQPRHNAFPNWPTQPYPPTALPGATPVAPLNYIPPGVRATSFYTP